MFVVYGSAVVSGTWNCNGEGTNSGTVEKQTKNNKKKTWEPCGQGGAKGFVTSQSGT